MNTPLWQPSDAARLKRLRAQTNIDAGQFARMATISTTQLHQLEDVGDSSFYSPTIKYQVGKKLLNLFGEQTTAECKLAPSSANKNTDLAPNNTDAIQLNDAIQARTSLAKIAETSNRELNPPAYRSIACSVRLCWKEHVVFSRLIALFFMLVIGNYFFKAPLLKMNKKYFSTNNKVLIESPITTFSEAIPASTPTSVGAVQIASSSADQQHPTPSCLWREMPIILKSPLPSKSGDYVYLVAANDVFACVMDKNKQTTMHSLKAGQSQTINGKAPFRIYSEKILDLKIYFQGYRIMIPSQETVDVMLTETPVTP